VWNLAVYAFLLVAWLRGLGRSDLTAARPVGLVRRLVQSRLGARLVRLLPGDGARTAITQVGARFADLWVAAARPLLAARVRVVLHLSAAALVLGLVAGMYLRGIAFEYRAQWESTFLGEEAAQSLLAILLGPASRLSGIELPALAGIGAFEGSPDGGGGPAAPWIHLWAITAALFVLLPRLALAGFDAVRAQRLARALPLDLSEPYWRRLQAPGGPGQRALVVPYGAALAPRAADRLRLLLHDVLGARAEIVQAEALAYGAEAEALETSGDSGCLVLVFSLAQTPELEVHARLLSELRAGAAGGARMLVVVDGSSYSERLGDSAAARERLAERRRAWERAAREAGLDVLHAELSAGAPEDLLERAEAALWTAPERGGTA
jgi:hypothetical protein